MLELVIADELSRFPNPQVGLHFAPLSEELKQGEALLDCR
jgi:hypothetical protein